MQVRCAQCAASVPLERDDAFLTCPFCSSTLYLDRAATFLSLQMTPALGEARARDLFTQALHSREIPVPPVRAVEAKLLPFWAVRGSEVQTTEAAFSPLPIALAGFRIPPAGVTASPEGDPGGFEAVACAETATTRWEEGKAPRGLALFHIPFYRIVFGVEGGREYEAWVEAAAGEVRLGELPAADTAAISRRAMVALGWVFAIVALESVLIPSPLISLILAAGLAAAAVPLLTRRMAREEAP